jgi:type IV pilus assembly protein PilP
MKKIKLISFSIIVIILTAVFFAFAADVKNVSAPPAPASSKATPLAKQATVQNPVLPAKASNTAPAAVPNPSKNAVSPAPAPAPVPPAPAPVDNYSYNPSGKPDPFKTFIVPPEPPAALKQKVLKKAAVSIFPLQRAEVDQYRVVGIAGDKDHRVAVVEDAAKKFYPLLIGTRIGLNDGKVIEIMADRVIVEEIENKKAKRIILKLRKN